MSKSFKKEYLYDEDDYETFSYPNKNKTSKKDNRREERLKRIETKNFSFEDDD